MYLFSKKIKCLSCSGNYKGIKERDKEKYICSSYTNYRTCTRYVVDQSKLEYLIANHLEIGKVKYGTGLSLPKQKGRPKKSQPEQTQISLQEITESVEQINIDPVNKTIEIRYNDNTRTYVSNNGIYY